MSSNDNPSKVGGQVHSTKGNVKEGLGRMTGATNLQQSGEQERLQGQTETEAARGQGYAQGTGERVGGMKDSTAGAVTGDRTQQTQGNVRQDKGAAQQDINRNL